MQGLLILGIGIITTAQKRDVVDAATMQAAITSMTTTNGAGAAAAVAAGASGAPDVTGFAFAMGRRVRTRRAQRLSSHSVARPSTRIVERAAGDHLLQTVARRQTASDGVGRTRRRLADA